MVQISLLTSFKYFQFLKKINWQLTCKTATVETDYNSLLLERGLENGTKTTIMNHYLNWISDKNFLIERMTSSY